MRWAPLAAVVSATALLGCPGGPHVFDGSTISLCVQEPTVSLRCFGMGGLAPGLETDVPDVRIVSYSGGGGGSCGLTREGEAVCWGARGAESEVPSGTWKSVRLGSAFGCGIRPDDSVECWGTDFYGETLPPPGAFRQVAPGYEHACGLRTDGILECWGGGPYGGQGSPPTGAGPFEELSGGSSTWCALDADRRLTCWDVMDPELRTPPSDAGVRKVAIGVTHACALMKDHSIRCWGEDTGGVVSDAPAGRFVDISASRYSSCALERGRRQVRCWGNIPDRQRQFHIIVGPAEPTDTGL